MSHPPDIFDALDSPSFGPLANQSDLPLDAPPLPAGTPLLPARMVNE